MSLILLISFIMVSVSHYIETLILVARAGSEENLQQEPIINNVSFNRDRIYRGLQTLNVVVNASDPKFPPEQLKSYIEILFSDGQSIRRPMIYLADPKLFDIRILIPSSAGLGSAIVTITVVNPVGLNATYSKEIVILDDRPLLNLKEETNIKLRILESISNISSLMGANVSAIADLKKEIYRLIDEAEIKLRVLEDVDSAISHYENASLMIDRTLELLNEVFRASLVVNNMLQDHKSKLEALKLIIMSAKSQRFNISAAEAMLNASERYIMQIEDLYRQGRYDEALISLRNITLMYDVLTRSLLDELIREVGLEKDTWNMYHNATYLYISALSRIYTLKLLGIPTAGIETYVVSSKNLLDKALDSLSKGQAVRAQVFIGNAVNNITIALSAIDSILRDHASMMYNYAESLYKQLVSKLIKPDTTYIEGLLASARDTLNNGDYITSVSLSNMAVQETLRLLKIASDQETYLVVGIAVVIAAAISAMLLLLTRRGSS